jgi:hypothetical protein
MTEEMAWVESSFLVILLLNELFFRLSSSRLKMV